MLNGPEIKYSETFDNGHSEEWTTSLQWTRCLPTAYVYIVHTFPPPKKGKPLNNGRNARPQCIHYSEVPLYAHTHRLCFQLYTFLKKDQESFLLFYLQVSSLLLPNRVANAAADEAYEGLALTRALTTSEFLSRSRAPRWRRTGSLVGTRTGGESSEVDPEVVWCGGKQEPINGGGGGLRRSLLYVNTVEPLIMDTPKSGQPPYNGKTVHPLPINCHYIEEGTTFERFKSEKNLHTFKRNF